MKKLLPVLAVIALVCGMSAGLVGCNTNTPKTTKTPTPTTTPTDKTSPTSPTGKTPT